MVEEKQEEIVEIIRGLPKDAKLHVFNKEKENE